MGEGMAQQSGPVDPILAPARRGEEGRERFAGRIENGPHNEGGRVRRGCFAHPRRRFEIDGIRPTKTANLPGSAARVGSVATGTASRI